MNRISYTAVLLIFFAMISPQESFAQMPSTHPTDYPNRLHLDGLLSLDSLTRYVHRHTGLRFSFNSAKVKGNTRLFFPKGEYSFTDLLRYIKKSTSLFYTLFNGYVIFQDHPPENKNKNSPAAQTNTVKRSQPQLKKSIKKTTHHTISDAETNAVTPITLHDSSTKTIPPFFVELPARQPVSIIKSNYADDTINSKARQISIDLPELNKASSPAKPDNPMKGKHAAKKPASIEWYAQAGFSTSEILYANLAYAGGIRALHLLLSVGTDFKIAGWQAGLGSVIISNPGTEWEINATVGFVNKNFPATDTFSHRPSAKGKIYTGSISWNKKINSKWTIKISPSFNVLKTRYYSNQQTSNPADFLPRGDNNPEHAIKLLSIPLLLQNTFSIQEPSNLKKWIGISAGIYYGFF